MSPRLSLGLDFDSVNYYKNFSFKSVFTYLLTYLLVDINTDS